MNFARRAKMIKNKAVVNEDASGNVLQLQAEIRRLRERLEHYRSSTSSSVTPSPASTPMTPSCPFPHSLSSYSMRSDDDKTIAELKEMLSSSLLAREKTESENSVSLLFSHPLITIPLIIFLVKVQFFQPKLDYL